MATPHRTALTGFRFAAPKARASSGVNLKHLRLSEYKMDEDTEAYVASRIRQRKSSILHIFARLPTACDDPRSTLFDSFLAMGEAKNGTPAERAARKKYYAAMDAEGRKVVQEMRALVKTLGITPVQRPEMRNGAHEPVSFVHMKLQLTGAQIKQLAAHKKIVALSRSEHEDLPMGAPIRVSERGTGRQASRPRARRTAASSPSFFKSSFGPTRARLDLG
jgi:hypothetical protein